VSDYSPEPWEIEETDNGIETNVCGPIKARYNRDNEKMRVEAEANAHLIVASPKMLEALEKINEIARDIGGVRGQDIRSISLAAIEESKPKKK
jgi:hypothetical protein